MRMRMLAMGGMAAIAISAAGCSSSVSSAPHGAAASAAKSAVASAASSAAAAAPSSALRTMTIGGVAVVTNAKGHTLYWFGPDTATTSKCTGGCAQIWPPVPGPLILC